MSVLLVAAFVVGTLAAGLPASSPASASPGVDQTPDVITADAVRFTALLASPVPERRVEGLQGLADLKHWPAEEAVLRLLKDGSPEVRRAAVLALGRLGGAACVPRFIELLDDPSWELRQQAWLSLQAITAQSFASDPAAWSQWWAQSTLAEKVNTLLAIARLRPEGAAPSRGLEQAAVPPPAQPGRRNALRALARLATPASEEALIQLLQRPQAPPLDADERSFICETLERVGSARAVPALAAQRSDAAAWALGRIGGSEAERALLGFPKTLPVLLALDRVHSTKAGSFLVLLVGHMGQITYRSQPDDVMNEDLQPIQRAGVNLIRRSGLAETFIECVLQELEDTMQPPIAHGPRPPHPPEWIEMFRRMRSELKPGFVREDGTTTSQPVVTMCYLLGGEAGPASEHGSVSGDTLAGDAPERIGGSRSGTAERERQRLVQRLLPLLRHPAVVPRVYVALSLGRMRAREALPALVEVIRQSYPFSDSTALASGKHFDQSQTVRWRGFLCMALGRMQGEEARQVLEQFATDSHQPRDIRYSAVVGLGFLGSTQSLPALARVAEEDIIWLVREEARRVAHEINLANLESRR